MFMLFQVILYTALSIVALMADETGLIFWGPAIIGQVWLAALMLKND